MFKFNPLTDEEIESLNIAEEGIYDFEVKNSEGKTSQSGNKMVKLLLMIWEKSGKTHTIFDYLVSSEAGLSIKKVKNFCYSVGLQDQYKKGELPDTLDNLSGKVQIGIKDRTSNGKGGFYDRQNIVVDYIVSEKKSDVNNQVTDDFKDSDLPF